ncbi:Fasciclin-like arabinogalactan family protein [Rhynchospora pubera]|uniref:Fasciclin-like arabinogalactan family protein n=1 Tax=Rhynchospora pubera TaxID=906938 RepID=A0AAV8EV51_9POAL|nr:Fasciclin-like arabinogalactan family protein [Rhynchospora pubera]KAJ4782393.1 Fasciclin-like arabinogalactan family protein [Rhynchospora pubera]KAJ4808826.1 Fasciclin-like arabinogalactan family protein [Rhynchospora pubera]
MTKGYIATLLIFPLISLILNPTSAQPASAPGPAGPRNVTAILEKGGQFTTLLRLMKSTQEIDQINNQLNNSNSGVTIFAPTDNAFNSLPAGTLNSLTDQQKVSLLQFHVIPNYLSTANFQTVSNPLRTQAGNSANGEFPLNVTAAGQQVNISTGVVNATVDNAVYSDGQLAVYQVNQVLLPQSIFAAHSPAAAPAPAEAKKDKSKPTSESPASSDDVDTTSNSATGPAIDQGMRVAFVGLFCLFAWGFL